MPTPPPAVVDARTLLHFVQQGDLDAALEAGLMAWSGQAGDGLADAERALLAATCQRLRTAWAARERYHARQERLRRREHERRPRRAALPPAPSAAPAPALPAAAAAILARARARAGIAPQ